MAPTAAVETFFCQQSRKVRKPLVEKQRRDRINNLLEHLKSIVLDSSQHEHASTSKLEKADILELTINYLCKVQQQTPGALHSAAHVKGACAGGHVASTRERQSFSPGPHGSGWDSGAEAEFRDQLRFAARKHQKLWRPW
ncbi:enhancer of split m3 protein-like [Lethenteron reissneri]|nr:enhancer of split m3 protein-like [Lethenteron reissneri]